MPRLPRFLTGSQPTNPGSPGPPMSDDPARQREPMETMLGHTPEQPDPGTVRPTPGTPPHGGSGRANFWGLPQHDELNARLTGQTGLRMFDEMYWTDAHIRRLVLAAWSPIAAGTWTLEPYGRDEATDQDRQIADEIWWALTQFMSPNLYGHLTELGPSLLRFGFTPFESQWKTVKHNGKTRLFPSKLGYMLPRTCWRWWQDDYGNLTHLGQILPHKPGVIVPASELVYYRLSAEGDNWMGRPLLRHAYKHWLLKDRLERIQAIGCERSAKGVPIVYHSPDIPGQTLGELEQLLANLHVSEAGYMMVPGWKMGMAPQGADTANQYLIDIVQYNSASDDSITKAISYHQQACTASFLEDFLELGHHQVGARATAVVQQDPFLSAVNGTLLPPVMPPLNGLVDRIRQLNWQDAQGSPQLKLTLHDEASMSEIATYVQQLVAAGAMQVDPELEDYLRDRASLPSANPQVRDRIEQERQQAAAATVAAQALDSNGEPRGAEPANPDAPPKPAARPAGKQLDTPPQPAAAGIVLQAADTGRLLMVQRADNPAHADARGRWEFPGGRIELFDRGDWQAAVREWQEETGGRLPDTATLIGTLRSHNGMYAAFVVTVRHEHDVTLGGPHDKHEIADVQWWTPASILASPHVRDHAKAMLPDIQRQLLQLDGDQAGFAPLSGGTGSENGLQMVPKVGVCACDTPDYANSACRACGGRQPKRTKRLDAPAPSAKWFEKLLSHHQLRQAFDGCRDHIQAAVGPAAIAAAQHIAYQAANGADNPTTSPPPELTDALAHHYEGLYHLGRQTVQEELGRQRRALGTQLDNPADTAGAAAVGARAARARQRGQHSAQNIVNKIREQTIRDQITGLQPGSALQTAAEAAALAQLRVEALANTTVSVNDGRYDEAMSASDVIGAYYSSVMDNRSCDPCIQADDGVLLSPEEAVAFGPPNPMCEGKDFCRCALVWVLSSDPVALQAITLDALPPEHRLMLHALEQHQTATVDQQNVFVRALDQERTERQADHQQLLSAQHDLADAIRHQPPIVVNPEIKLPKPKRTRRRLIRDETGRITGSEDELA